MQDKPYPQMFELSDARRSRFIVLSTYMISAFALFTLVTLHLSGMNEPRRLAGNLLLLLGMLAANLLCRSGRVTAAAHVLVWSAFGAVCLVSYATGGFRSAASNVYLTLVAFAGWLLGMRYLVATTVLSLLAMLLLFILGLEGMLPAPAPSRPSVQFATAWSAIALGGLLFYFVVVDLRSSWRKEWTLRQDLKRVNDELELKVAQRTQELARARDAAEQASRAKGAFLASISHEIRTPMHAIVGLAEVLQRESNDPQVRNRLALVEQASDHLLALVNNVLDISKIESGKFELAAVEMRIGDVFTRVLSMLQEQAQRKGLTLAAELDVDASHRVVGDPTRLAQVLLNFAGNALKYTETGTVTLRCHPIEGGVQRSMFRFEVQDTGVGVAPADQARIFEPFEQGDDATAAARSGSGLGLAINRLLVRAMGGEVGMQSTPGQGSLFWFTARLPPAPVAALARDPVDEVDAAGTDRLRASLAGARLLVVDDNEVNRIIACAQLNMLGLEPDQAEDGLQAVEMASRATYDLILMDVHMPVLDGIEATRRIRAIDRYRNTPIIAVTADAFTADRQRVLDAGMSDHLAKPLPTQQLHEALAKWLAVGRRSRPAND
jgi:signal transduction histidine kinase/ActR/RegA family two-component response regulator